MSYHERKRDRIEYYKKYQEGWKLRKCVACNGSGVYDNDGSPPCGACDGTGGERYDSRKETKDGLPILTEK